MDKEIWVSIPGYDGYEVSSHGRVLSKAKSWRSGRKYGRLQHSEDTFLTPHRTKKGTVQVSVKSSRLNLARVVATVFIPNPENKPFVDHIDGDILNNHVSNLRWATNEENQINRDLMATNTTGFLGVYPAKGRWRARVHLGGKKVSLGGYSTKEEAARAVHEARVAHYGEFVRPPAGSVPPSALG